MMAIMMIVITGIEIVYNVNKNNGKISVNNNDNIFSNIIITIIIIFQSLWILMLIFTMLIIIK